MSAEKDIAKIAADLDRHFTPDAGQKIRAKLARSNKRARASLVNCVKFAAYLRPNVYGPDAPLMHFIDDRHIAAADHGFKMPKTFGLH